MSWKELFKLNPWSFSIALLLQMAGAAGEIGVAYFLTLQFNAVRNRNLQMFIFWTVLQIVCYVFVYLFYNVAGIIWQKHVQRYLHLIRQELTDHYFEDGKSHHAGSVQNRMTNDLTLLHNDYLNSFRYVAGMLVSVFSVALTLFTFQWSLLLACLIFAAVQIYLPKLMDKQLQKVTSLVSDANKKYLKTLGDWLIGLSELVLADFLTGFSGSGKSGFSGTPSKVEPTLARGGIFRPVTCRKASSICRSSSAAEGAGSGAASGLGNISGNASAVGNASSVGASTGMETSGIFTSSGRGWAARIISSAVTLCS